MIKRNILELAVFICGAIVMIYEIIGSRIVSPYIGTSTYVWTSLIGVILGSLSLGYWIGGRVADRRPSIRMLALVIFVAAALVSVTVLVKDVALSAIAAMPFGLEIKSVLASLLLFAPASVAFGFVTPYAVKLRMLSIEDSGKTVGRLYALSTVGSIAGTFLAGFVLVPFVGSTRTLYLLAVVLVIVSALIAPLKMARANVMVLILAAIAIISTELTTFYARSVKDLHDIDTEYSRVQIFKATDHATDRPIRAMAIDPYFVQSVIYLDGDELFARYTHYYHLIRTVRPGFRRTLMIGGAGYSFPQKYLQTYPDAEIDVVEIDPGMTRIARRFFRLRDDPRMRIIHEDGRVFLNHAEAGGYDAVLMDAFGSLFSVPYQLTTLEAVRHVSRVLNDDGVVIFNVGSAIRGDASRFLQAELATYRSVFTRVYLFKVQSERQDDETQNLVIVACKADCGLSNSTADPEIERLLSNRYAHEFPIAVPPLTDDLAPVEYYNSFGQNLAR